MLLIQSCALTAWCGGGALLMLNLICADVYDLANGRRLSAYERLGCHQEIRWMSVGMAWNIACALLPWI